MPPTPSLSGGPGATPPSSPDRKSSTPGPPRSRRRLASPPRAFANPRADPLRATGFALTAVSGAPPRANAGAHGVKLADLVAGAPDVCFASNFCVDPAWLLGSFPALRTASAALVLAIGDASILPGLRRALEDKRIVPAPVAAAVAPRVERYGTHHSKFFILRYPSIGTRVVIVTGNFLVQEYDAKTQGVWWQDFPCVAEGQTPPRCDFGDTLTRYIAALALPTLAQRALNRVLASTDFSSARADLVAAIPGNHDENAAALWGRGRLGSLLAGATGFHPSLIHAPIIAQCSSMGKLDERWVAALVEAASGGTARGAPEKHNQPTPLGLPAAAPGVSAPFSIVWPTVDQVRNSAEGWMGGSSIPGRREYLELPTVASRLHTWSAAATARCRAMPHIKTLARACPRTGRVAWAVLGSANLSAAAWGGVPTKAGKTYVKSFELGVLLTPAREAAYRAHPHYGFCAHPLPPDASLFNVPPPPPPAVAAPAVDFWAVGARQVDESDGVQTVRLPIPYDLPLTPYGRGDVPWASGVAWPGADVFGRCLVGE